MVLDMARVEWNYIRTNYGVDVIGKQDLLVHTYYLHIIPLDFVQMREDRHTSF